MSWTGTDADAALVGREPDLPSLRLVLDPGALTEVVARGGTALAGPAQVHRLRLKPGRSVQAAVVAPLAGGGTRWWLLTGFGPAGLPKLGKDAAAGGEEAVVDDRDRWCLAPATTDRALRLHRAWAALVGADPAAEGAVEVLAYNPRRRLVARATGPHGDGLVVKVYADPALRLPRTIDHALVAAGVPTPARTVLPGTHARRVQAARWVEGREADPATDGTALARALGVLHRSDVLVPGRVLGAADLAAATAAAARSLGALLPDLAVPVARVARVIGDALLHLDADRPSSSGVLAHPALGAVGLLHGDLSPDQVVVRAGETWLLDLDDCRRGPLAWDAATWTAAQVAVGATEPCQLPGTEPAPLLQAAALVLRSVEPFRRRRPSWDETARRMVALATELVGSGPARRAVRDGLGVGG